MSDETRIADLDTIKALANLLGEHPRSAQDHNCAGCQTEGYSLFTYYVHVARAVLAAGYVSPADARENFMVLLTRDTEAHENYERAQKAEAHAAELERAVDRVRNLHSQDASLLEPGKWCPGCGQTAPCSTIRALNEPKRIANGDDEPPALEAS